MRKLLWLILLLATPALATDYYVRTDGNDANTGLTNTSGGAWASPSRCATLTGGNRCRIQPGSYYVSTPITQANSGSLKANDVATCTCTKGSTTISCTSAPSGVVAGDWVRCDASGSFFNWARVSSVAGTTINLESAYLGDGGYLGESTGGTAFLDVASMVEVVGDGSLGGIVITRTQAQPGGVTWTQSGTYPEVWSYPKSSGTGAWADPKGFRQTAATWDRWYRNRDGEDAWIRVSVGACPCSTAATCETHVENVAGSWCDDGTRIWAHALRDANVSTSGVRASNAGTDTSTWTAVRDYFVMRNLWFDTAGQTNGYNTDVTHSFIFGGSNSMLKDVTSAGATCRFNFDAARTRMEVRGVDCLDKMTATTGNWNHSGLRFYDLEVRGGYSNGMRIPIIKGTSPSDRVLFDRVYLHRIFTWYRTTECAGDNTYVCATESFDSDKEWAGAHGAENGSSTEDNGMNYIVIQNSIIEITGDGWNTFNSGSDVIYRNNTFGYSNSYNANMRQEGLEFGVNGLTAGISAYNNIFYMDERSSQVGYMGVLWNYGTTWANYVGNNNLYLYPWNLVTGLNAPTSTQTFKHVGGTEPDPEDYSHQTMITSRGQETNSITVCYGGCTAANARVYNDGTNSREYFIKPTTSDGTVSDYTPVKDISRAINAGLNAQCPTEDFYGNPRADGQCDIGAVEYQGSFEPAGPHRTHILPGTKIQ